MTYQAPWAYAESPADSEDERPWLKDRHHPLLGHHVPPVLVPDWPEMHVEPAYQLHRVLPTAFKAYSRVNGDVIVDAGDTYEQARWNLRRFVEGRG